MGRRLFSGKMHFFSMIFFNVPDYPYELQNLSKDLLKLFILCKRLFLLINLLVKLTIHTCKPMSMLAKNLTHVKSSIYLLTQSGMSPMTQLTQLF